MHMVSYVDRATCWAHPAKELNRVPRKTPIHLLDISFVDFLPDELEQCLLVGIGRHCIVLVGCFA